MILENYHKIFHKWSEEMTDQKKSRSKMLQYCEIKDFVLKYLIHMYLGLYHWDYLQIIYGFRWIIHGLPRDFPDLHGLM